MVIADDAVGRALDIIGCGGNLIKGPHIVIPFLVQPGHDPFVVVDRWPFISSTSVALANEDWLCSEVRDGCAILLPLGIGRMRPCLRFGRLDQIDGNEMCS